MGKNKITILVLGFVAFLITGFAFYNSAEAANPSVFVLPASLNKNIGDVFDLYVMVNSAGEKVCAVEGSLNLDKLFCQSITVGEGVMAQSSPSCDNLYFLFGIPGCTVENKALFTVRVKANNVGAAAVNFTGVDIIGEGVSLSSDSSGGSYSLTQPEIALPLLTLSCNCDDWGSWQEGDCGGGDCVSAQLSQFRTRACEPAACAVETESRCAEDDFCVSSFSSTTEGEAEGEEIKREESEKSENLLAGDKPFFLATIGNILSLGTDNTLVSVLVGAVIILALVCAFYYLRQKSRKKIQNN